MKQISVFAENKKGMMEFITRTLSDGGINICGSVTNDSAEYGIVRMVVDNPESAQQLLTDAGILSKLTEVSGVEIEDTPGSLTRLLEVLTYCNVNVEYLYLSFSRSSAKPVMIFRTSDRAEVESYLSRVGFHVVNELD